MIIAPDSDNLNVLITGRSGSGKTYALKEIEKNIAMDNGAVLVLNHHGTHADIKGKERVRWINALTDGIPITMLTPLPRRNGTYEDMEDVIASVVDIFCSIHPLQIRQKSILREAVRYAMCKKDTSINEISAIGEALTEIPDGEMVFECFYQIFTKGKVCKGKPIIERGCITVIDFDHYNETTQVILAELLLECLWRYFYLKGQDAEETLFVVCDEFQVFNLRKNSILSKILREGRKYHLALILVTQTLSGFETSEKVVLQQAATQIYFHPAMDDVKYIAKSLPGEEKEKIKEILLNLNKGECLAVGKFKIGEISKYKHFLMKF